MVDFNSTEALACAHILVIFLVILFGGIIWWIKFHDD